MPLDFDGVSLAMPKCKENQQNTSERIPDCKANRAWQGFDGVPWPTQIEGNKQNVLEMMPGCEPDGVRRGVERVRWGFDGGSLATPK